MHQNIGADMCARVVGRVRGGRLAMHTALHCRARSRDLQGLAALGHGGGDAPLRQDGAQRREPRPGCRHALQTDQARGCVRR